MEKDVRAVICVTHACARVLSVYVADSVWEMTYMSPVPYLCIHFSASPCLCIYHMYTCIYLCTYCQPPVIGASSTTGTPSVGCGEEGTAPLPAAPQ